MIIGSKIIERENVSSTNDLAATLARAGSLPEGTIVVGHNQYQGRGQSGNSWESEPFKNLTVSVILRPKNLHPSKQFTISKMVSLAIIGMLSKYMEHLSIKWPNDIYHKGDKIAGILIENTLSGNRFEMSIAGIGININQDRFPEHIPNPASMKMITRKDHEPRVILDELSASLDSWYSIMSEGLYERIDSEYLDMLYRHGKSHEFSSGGKFFTGTIIGVDETGHLLVDDGRGNVSSYGFREIDFIS